MASHRRFKVLLILVLLAVFMALYLTSSASSTRSSVFYGRTQDALAAQRAAKEASLGHMDNSPTDDAPIDTGGDDVGKRLKEAEEAAKKAADRKAEEFHGEAGREKAEQMALKDKQEISNAAAKDAAEDRKEEVKKQQPQLETEEQSKVKDELNSILKQSPIIIFSKSYCPYSRKAKDILLQKYKITPLPFVVELDEHPLGPKLQDELASSTGRRTVPNILINGKSIGGGDDVAKLHREGNLIETLKSMGGKRVEVSVVESEQETHRRRRRK